MGKLLGLFGTVMVYFCVASMITLGLLAVYAKSQGYLEPQKVAMMLAVARGEALPNAAAQPAQKVDDKPKTFAEWERQNQVREKDLDLREQAIKSESLLLEGERLKLLEKIENFAAEKRFYSENLNKLITTKEDEGRAAIRQIWESVKPKQAKELMLTMINKGENEEVARIFSFMPIAKQAKIIAEFKTPEDQIKIDELLRLLRLDRQSLPTFDGETTESAPEPSVSPGAAGS
ncbi:MAG: hypothetical protein SFX18_05225 [Pirellulales bacterium]|nr:hypothetical protein [Pirellulales bacterium]